MFGRISLTDVLSTLLCWKTPTQSYACYLGRVLESTGPTKHDFRISGALPILRIAVYSLSCKITKAWGGFSSLRFSDLLTQNCCV
ncbi:hypothetical protein BJX70DRAFT_364251 [Aspergillus crustosus]